MVPSALPPNGLELSCPAEAGMLRSIVRLAGGQSKRPRKRRPPGQLQRVVGRHASVAHRTNAPSLGTRIHVLPILAARRSASSTRELKASILA